MVAAFTALAGLGLSSTSSSSVAVGPVAGPAAAGQDVIPGVRPLRAIVGLARGWVARNRVYRDIDEYRKEANALHDAYVATAKEQLAKGTAGGLRPGQLAQYRRTIALLEQEKSARETYLNAQATGAKQVFTGRVNEVLKAAISATPLGQRTIAVLVDGFDFGRRSIDGALASLDGSNAGALIAKLGKVRSVGQLASGVTGPKGRDAFTKLDRVLGAPLDQIDRLRPRLEDLSSTFAATADDFRAYGASSRVPKGRDLAKAVAVSVAGLDGDRPGSSASVEALARRRPNIRAQARSAILAGAQARCTAKAIGYRALLAQLEQSLGDDAPAALGAVCQAIDLDATDPTDTDTDNGETTEGTDGMDTGSPEPTDSSSDDSVTVTGTVSMPLLFTDEFVRGVDTQTIELTFPTGGGSVTGTFELVFRGVGDVDGNCPFTFSLSGGIAGQIDPTGHITGQFSAPFVIDIDGPADDCFEVSADASIVLDGNWNSAEMLVTGTLTVVDPDDPSETMAISFEAAPA